MLLPVEKFSSIDFVFIYAVDDKVVFFDSVYFTPEANVGEFVVCLTFRIEKIFGSKNSDPEFLVSLTPTLSELDAVYVVKIGFKGYKLQITKTYAAYPEKGFSTKSILKPFELTNPFRQCGS